MLTVTPSNNVYTKKNSPNTCAVSFEHKVGVLLDASAAAKRELLKDTLELKLSKKTQVLPEAFQEVINKFFPDANIKIKDINEAENFIEPNGAEKVLSDIKLNQDKPQSVVFADFDSFKKDKKDKSGIDLFVQKVLEHNDVNYVSNIASDFAQKIKNFSTITSENVHNLADEVFKKFNLDMKLHINDSKFDTLGTKAQSIGAKASSAVDFADNSIVNSISADFTHPVEHLSNELAHEFTHIIQFNSPMFNPGTIGSFPAGMAWKFSEPQLMRYGLLKKDSPIVDAININGVEIPVLNEENKQKILNNIVDASTQFVLGNNNSKLYKELLNRSLMEAQAHTKQQSIANYKFDYWGCEHYGSLYQEFANILQENMNKISQNPAFNSKPIQSEKKGIIDFLKSKIGINGNK